MNVRTASLFVCLTIGLTTLAAQTPQSPFDDVYAAIRNGDHAALDALLRAGADVNARTSGGATALMRAVTDPAKVRLLIEHGAEVNAAAESGRTPLMLAAMSDRSSSIVGLLLARGADARAADKDRMTVALAAAIGDDVEAVRRSGGRHPAVYAPQPGRGGSSGQSRHRCARVQHPRPAAA
jgi:hypothetical protein